MSDGAGDHVSPDEAFQTLGNETRMAILRELAKASGPTRFSELRDSVGIRQGAQFNYHLDKLVGHFVERTDDGYRLLQPGRHVVEAVLSGAVTERPERGPEPVDNWSCPYCGGVVAVSYADNRVQRQCTECDGFLGPGDAGHGPSGAVDRGNLGSLALPPAGVEGRSGSDLLRAAVVRGYSEWFSTAKGVCPRCAAAVTADALVCEDHDAGDGFCASCGKRHAVRYAAACENCPFETESAMSMYLMSSPPALQFTLDLGFDPIVDVLDWGWEYEEDVLSVDPFEARFTFPYGDDTLTLLVDDDLTVTRVDADGVPADE